MPNYPYDSLDAPLDLSNLEKTNKNFVAIAADIASVDSKTTISINSQQQQISNLVAQGDSSPEAAQARVGLYGEDYPSLKDRIDGDLTDISVNQINKNRGKFDQTYMSDELLAQIAGTASINATPALNSVTIAQTAFYSRSSNLFNKLAVTTDAYVSGTTGALVTSGATGFVTSDFILVKPSTAYKVRVRRYVAFYTSAKVFISGIHGVTGTDFTTPANTMFVRFSWLPANDVVSLDQQQLNEGTALLAYEAYREFIPATYVEQKFDSSLVPTASISAEKVSFASVGTNLFDKTQYEANKTLTAATGVTSTATNFGVSAFIPASPGSYTIKNARVVSFYGTNKAFISSVTLSPFANVTVTAPANTLFLRFSWFLNDASIDVQQINAGTALLPYESFAYRLSPDVLPTSVSAIVASVEIILPEKVYGLVGQELNIYFDNVFTGKDKDFDFDVTCSVGQHMTDRFRITPTVAGSYTLTITALKNEVVFATATTTLIIKSATVGTGVTKKVLVIGDSTTAAGTPIVKLNENFNADPMDITMIGTKGTSPNNYEAIAGWTARMFRTLASDPVVPTSINKFYNSAVSDFDFSYFMTQNSYSSVDYVIINLGINDLFSFTTDATAQTKITEFLADYDFFIASIKAFNASIKIGICLTIPPNYSQDAFGKQYGNGQTRQRYKRNNLLLVKALINKYKAQESNNIYLVPIDTNLDTKNNMGFESEQINARNTTMISRALGYGGVHPAEPGFWQVADVYWYWLKSFES